MAGFNSKKIDVLLNLKDERIKRTCILELDYLYIKKDWQVKLRNPMSEFSTIID